MTPWLDDGDVQLYHGSALDVLRSLPAGSVQTCVTSPPYWGLRDYQTASWDGGDPEHDHDREPHRNGRGGSGAPGKQTVDAFPSTTPAAVCSCGARRVDAQLGLEPTPSEYVAALVAVFAEVWRVLRDDGTLWLNLGDSYNAHPGGGGDRGGRSITGTQGTGDQPQYRKGHGLSKTKTLKPKDLVGVPWRVAFALQEAGWYLRSDIIWAKPNPMPESVTDRPTKAHEYVFLLAKQPRYYYDADAIREPNVVGAALERPPRHLGGRQEDSPYRPGAVAGANGHNLGLNPAGRNARSVWEIATQPTPEAHFATFPEALVRRCILAGSREGDLVLDPFVGSGTTCLVARKHGRRATGIDLSADYLAIATRRLGQQSLFAQEMGA